ncbi:MAG: hypothetical protein CTY20_11300 [Hyphomicrobium sp.]|nr:MAG: hypothetical protein CTY20_11300 [Hyphomicrobium sp.]
MRKSCAKRSADWLAASATWCLSIRSNGANLVRDQFHLIDLGYRCMAECAARAFVTGIIEADGKTAHWN